MSIIFLTSTLWFFSILCWRFSVSADKLQIFFFTRLKAAITNWQNLSVSLLSSIKSCPLTFFLYFNLTFEPTRTLICNRLKLNFKCCLLYNCCWIIWIVKGDRKQSPWGWNNSKLTYMLKNTIRNSTFHGKATNSNSNNNNTFMEATN